MSSSGTSGRRSALAVVAGGALAYVVAMLARSILVPDSVTETHFGRGLDISLLYAITLLPGILVGGLYGRKVLEYGFLAGVLGEILRAAAQLLLAFGSIPAGVEPEVPWLSTLLGTFLQAMPSGVLGAAGGAVGFVLHARATARRRQQDARI